MVAEFSSAVGGMEGGEIAGASWEDAIGDDWDGLERDISALARADMASKAHLLQSLSSFLSCVATTMSFSTEVNALSASVGTSAIFLGHKEVAQLHELVVGELKDQTYFLSALAWISNKQMDEGADGNFMRVLNLKIVSQTLRCCIRILPLVEYFDKHASLASTKLLDDILQQLCHPTELFQLLGLKGSEDMLNRRYQTAQGEEVGKYLQNTESPEACMSNSLDMDSQHRKELIFALLEVYLDELLLHPDLIARLLRSREDPCRSLAQGQVTCRVKHTEASLEAAFVHVLLSLHPAAPGLRRKGYLVGNLSLPAGLILLEKFSGEGVPPFYVAHIVRFLARILNDTTPAGFGHADDLSKTRRTVVKNCWAGGVDWSYCSQELLPNFDFNDCHLPTTSSPSETTLNFASSILEQAILLYSSISLAPDTCSDGIGSSRCQSLDEPLLEFYLSKYTPLFDVFGQSPELNTIDRVSGSAGIRIGHVNSYGDKSPCWLTGALDTESDSPLEDVSGTIGFVGEFVHQSLDAGFYCVERRTNVAVDKEDDQDSSGLVVALLQLISCALKCIAREVYTSTWLPDAFGDQVLDTRAMLSSDSNKAYFDKILQCVGLYLSLCVPSGTGLVSTCHERRCGRAGEEDDGGSNLVVWPHGSLNILVGQAIVFFTNILGHEVRRGASDETLETYFHLVESLVALLLALDERNHSKKSTSESGLICEHTLCDDICRTSVEVSRYEKCIRCSSFENDVQQLSKSDSTSSYLEEMVLSLRGMLQELFAQQRPMPEFLLSFIFKQLSKPAALSLTAMAFSSCLNNHLVLEPITRRTELFESEGLLAEVLNLALAEPTKPCSLFTFMAYMVDILQDRLSITTILSTSEVAEPISWFETIAYSLTLASQLVVHERSMLVRNGEELFISFIFKMSEGIDRVLTEGTAAAHWLSDHCKTMSEEEWHKSAGAWESTGSSTGNERCFGGEAWNVTGSLGKCNIFLRQVDMLRNAVEELARSVDPSLHCELTPLLEKGRIFFAALSHLIAEQKLQESQWSLYLSGQNQHRSPGKEPGSHLPANSLDVGLECDHIDRHQTEFADRATEEISECQETPVRDVFSIGSQTFLTEKVSCTEELSLKTSDHLAGQEEAVMTQSNKESIVSTAELIMSSTLVTVERLLTRSATSLITQKLDTHDHGLGPEKRQPTPQERKPCSGSTSAIIKRLLRKNPPSRRKSTCSYQICQKRPAEVETKWGQDLASYDFVDGVVTHGDVPASTSSNLFVDSLNKLDTSDNFDDLKDFIVSKKGRDYSVWLKRRQKVRRRLHSKTFFKRLQEKKELLLLLDI